MSLRSYSDKIEFNAPAEEVFKFFTDTDHLAELMPSHYRFRILRRSARHLSQGVLLECEMRIVGVPTHWKAFVSSMSPGRHITSLWERGVLSFVEHNVYFESLPNNQSRVTDCMLYRLPLGPLAPLADRMLVLPSIRRLFEYRRQVLLKVFRAAEKPPQNNSQPWKSSSFRAHSSARKSRMRSQSTANLVLQKQP
jgi:ligand-binding SRPBCC domain-containing protein